MKKFFYTLLVLVLGLLLINSVSAKDDSKNINLTCISNDKSMTQTVIIFRDKSSKLNKKIGFVNGNIVTVDETAASYILKHEIGPEESTTIHSEAKYKDELFTLAEISPLSNPT